MELQIIEVFYLITRDRLTLRHAQRASSMLLQTRQACLQRSMDAYTDWPQVDPSNAITTNWPASV